MLLIVEDDSDMRSLLIDELWGEGYHLQAASNGEEAVASVKQAVPDLIITDLRMPSGGLDYLQRLRTHAPACPIILMTSFGDSHVKQEALRRGATAYFDKPVRLSELKSTVKQLLNHGANETEGVPKDAR